MSYTQELLIGHEIASWIEQKSYKLDLLSSPRTKISSTCFLIALEHHQAILLLISQDAPFHTSAFTLIRSVFETYIRGLWLLKCASDEELNNFIQGSPPPAFQKLINSIETACGFDIKHFTDIRSQSWSIMCDYTHTGDQQIRKWNNLDTIEPNHSDKEVKELLIFTSALALLSVVPTNQCRW